MERTLEKVAVSGNHFLYFNTDDSVNTTYYWFRFFK
jgi:hypothetical protein